MVPEPSLFSLNPHMSGAARIPDYQGPIDMARIGRTGADEKLIRDPASFRPNHFLWKLEDRVATITLNRPEKKNPLTFDSYAELRDTFLGLQHCPNVQAVIIKGAGGNFCTGGDVIEIIKPLLDMDYTDRLLFTQMTGDLIKAIRNAPQAVIASIEGKCFGAGAAIAMASDVRYGTKDSEVGFIFTKVGLAGCDMGACSILPRIIGEGRAREILIWGKTFDGAEAREFGFYNSAFDSPEALGEYVSSQASRLLRVAPRGVTLTKKALTAETVMSVDAAIDFEAEMQARAMADPDFREFCKSFMEKRRAVFTGEAPPDKDLSGMIHDPLPQVNLPDWKRSGYAHAVDYSDAFARRLRGGGMTGMGPDEKIITPWNPGSPATSEILVAQATKTFQNIASVIKYAGENPSHLTLIRFYVRSDFVDLFKDAGRDIGVAYRESFGRNFPAEALIGVSRLFDPTAIIEVEWELHRPKHL